NGRYDSISMNWLNNATIALALRRHPEPLESGVNDKTPKSDPDQPDVQAPPNRPDGLQLIVVTGAGSVAPLNFPCPMSALSWSAHGVYAVGQGDAGAPPVILDRRNSTCTIFHVPVPIHVLDWDEDDEGSFLYVGPDSLRRTIGLGNQKLTFRMAIDRPEAALLAQVAISRPEQSELDVKPLGFDTTAE